MLKFMLAVMLVIFAVPSMVVANTEHCPSGGEKVEAKGDDLNDIVLDAGTLFCVKGSTDATGILEADGETSLVVYLDNGHDVSYYVVYEEEASSSQSPKPTPTMSVAPTPTPSVVPSMTPTPSVKPTPVVTPVATPTPTPVTPTSPSIVPSATPSTTTDTPKEKATDTVVTMPDTAMPEGS